MPAFVTDSFTDTNGVAITSHTGELGATWTKHALANNTGHPTISGNALVTTETSKNENYYASAVPASADYSVSLRYNYFGGAAEIAGPAARLSTSAATGYYWIYFQSAPNQLRLYKYVAGVLTQIGAGVAFTPANGASYTLTLEVVGTTLKGRMQRLSDSLWINSAGSFGSTQVDAISTTDTSISDAGRVGWWFAAGTPGGGFSRGTIDTFSAGQDQDAATAITLAGPSSGPALAASSNFTAGANGSISGTVVVTPSDGAGGGAFTPTTVSISSASPTATFTYTPATAGTKAISVTNNGGLANPAAISYEATNYTRIDATEALTGAAIMVLVPNAGATAGAYNAAAQTKVCVYVHGVGETETALLSDALKKTTVTALIDAGYILAGAAPSNFGSTNGVEGNIGLCKYLQDNYNVGGIAVWGQSMGGLASLNLVSSGRVSGLVGWLGTYPICSLSAAYNGTGGSNFSATINTDYGITGTGTATYANKAYGRDPALREASAWRHLPMRWYASAGDLTVGKSQNTDSLAARIAGMTREAEVVVCSGVHGDPSHFQPSDYLAFFDRCFSARVAAIRPTATKTVTLTLTSDGTTPRPSLPALKWTYFEAATPTTPEFPMNWGTVTPNPTTAVMTVTVNTDKPVGGVGRMEVTSSDGTVAQAGMMEFCGPVELTA